MLQLVAHFLHSADDPQVSEKGASQPGNEGGEELVEKKSPKRIILAAINETNLQPLNSIAQLLLQSLINVMMMMGGPLWVG